MDISHNDKMTLLELLGGGAPWFRPLQGGEYVDNKDGSFSTERTVTERLPNEGPIANFPSLWQTGNGPVELPWQDASTAAGMYENANGRTFPRYGNYDAGIAASKEKSANGGTGGSPNSKVSAILRALIK